MSEENDVVEILISQNSFEEEVVEIGPDGRLLKRAPLPLQTSNVVLRDARGEYGRVYRAFRRR